MGKSIQKCVPLDYIKEFVRRYPNIWELTDIFIAGKKNKEFDWDDRCYLPISAAIACVTGGDPNLINYGNYPALCAALAAWRLNKAIYKFDTSLANELFEQADEMIEIPIDILNKIPYYCVYIQFDDPEGVLDGFFVHFESDPDGHTELRALYLFKDSYNTLPSALHLVPNGLISDGVRESVALSKKNMINRNPLYSNISLNNETEKMAKLISQWLQLVLYICAENAEINENREQKKIYRKDTTIKDKLREVKRFDVGTEMGVMIRNYRWRTERQNPSASCALNNNNGNTNQHSSKSAHLRKAHWHTYMTGPGRKEPKLRWLNMMEINPENKDNEVVKVIHVNKDIKKDTDGESY